MISKRVLIPYCLVAVYLIVVGFDVQHDDGIIGRTQKNGSGCTCHNLTADTSVHVWISGPSTVPAGTNASYSVFMTGGPAVAGGFNVATSTGTLSPANIESKLMSGELTHTAPKIFSSGTVQWNFSYQAPNTAGHDTLYSAALSVNQNAIPDPADRWNFGSTFVISVTPVTHSLPLMTEIGLLMLVSLLLWLGVKSLMDKKHRLQSLPG